MTTKSPAKTAPKVALVPSDNIPAGYTSYSRPPPTLRRLQVVMDLDECMLFARDISTTESKKHNLSSKFFRVWTDGPLSYALDAYVRPGLKNFLHEVSKFADLYVMTAGNNTYARPLIKLIDPEAIYFKDVITREKFDFRIGKNLKVIGESYCAKRTVLVDNMASNFCYQRSNGILVREYRGSHFDNNLDYVLTLLRYLRTVDDVRVTLRVVHMSGQYYHPFVDELVSRL